MGACRIWLPNKLRFIPMLIVLVFSCQVIGKPDTTKAHFKKWALQFQIDREFSLSSFQGTVISIKRNFMNNTALRFGLSLNGFARNSEQQGHYSNDSTPNEIEIKNRSIDIEFSSQIIFYPIRGDIKYFIGGGPLIKYSYNSDDNITPDPFGDPIDRLNKRWILGFSFPIGGEWYFNKNMSLSAEYGLSLIYEMLEEERWNLVNNPTSQYYTEKFNSKTFRVIPSNVLFGLSVYF